MDFNILYLAGRFSCDFYSERASKVTENIYKHSYKSPYRNRLTLQTAIETIMKLGKNLNRWPGTDLDRTCHAYIISLKCATFLCEQICEKTQFHQ